MATRQAKRTPVLMLGVLILAAGLALAAGIVAASSEIGRASCRERVYGTV